MSVFLVQIGLASDDPPIEMKEGTVRRLPVSRIVGVRSQNPKVVVVERDPFSGSLRLRAVKSGTTALVVDFRDTGASDNVVVRVLGNSKNKITEKKVKGAKITGRLLELPGW